MNRTLFALFLAVCSLQSGFALPVRRDSLPNGLIVVTYEDHRLPICDLGLVCRSGAAFDPPGKAGVASLTADLLFKGMPGVSADSFAAIVEFLGARTFSTADFDRSAVGFRVLAKDLEQGLDLLAGSVLRPTFPAREFKLAAAQTLAEARQRYESPGFVVSAAFSRLAYGNHPCAFPASGDTGTLRRVTRDDLVRFHRTHYLPNNCFIVAVGDFDPAELLEQVRARFGDWQPGAAPALELPPLPEPAGIRAKLITRPDLNQTYVHLGHPGIAMSDPDVLPARLMSYILGGGAMSSRLGLAVRERGGLAYDVRCWFDRMKLTGMFNATVQTARPKLAIELMLAEIQAMHDSGATPAEMLKSHNYFTGSFPLTYSSNQGKSSQVGYQELHRLGNDWLERFPGEVSAVTLEQVNQAARARLRPGNCFMVIVGPVTRQDLDIPGIEWID